MSNDPFSFLCALRAGAAYELDFRITQEPVADPDTRTLSWLAEENGALYTLEASLNLLPPWFAAGYVPAAEDQDLLEDELVELEVTTDAERMFFRVVRDNGIRIDATCVEGEGVRLDVDITRWVSRTPGYLFVSQMLIERSLEAGGPFDPVAVVSSPVEEVTVFDRTADPDTAYYYRVSFSYYDNILYDEFDSPPSNVAYVFTGCAPPAAPVLTASCRPGRIALSWSRPEWMKDASLSLQQWFLERSTDPDAPFDPDASFDPVILGTEYLWEPGGFFVDTTNVLPETTYHYRISFTYTGQMGGGTFISSPFSTVVSAKPCEEPRVIPAIDVAWIVDNTESAVEDFIIHLRDEPNPVIDGILDAIADASGGNYRHALVTTDTNIVNVRLGFSMANRVAFKTKLQEFLHVTGGLNPEESTDECLNTVVNALWASDRIPPVEVQHGDFDPPFGIDEYDDEAPAYLDEFDVEIEPLKIIILITDDLPGGFEDLYTPEVRENAEHYARQARCQDIRINAILVNGGSWEARNLMLEYARITEGWYALLQTNGNFLEDALLQGIYGELPDIPEYCP